MSRNSGGRGGDARSKSFANGEGAQAFHDEKTPLVTVVNGRNRFGSAVYSSSSGLEESNALSVSKHSGDNGEQRVYWTRWYMLTVCSLIAFAQGAIWNNFGPIDLAVKPLFGWNHATIALLANWGPICYLIAFIPSAWLLSKGVRPAAGSCILLLSLGSALRCFTAQDPQATILIHAGQFLNGLAGPVALAMGPTLSAAWFPVNERVLATGICSTFNFLGVAFSFLIGPLVVKQPDEAHFDRNTTTWQFMWYMWGEGLWCTVCLLCVLIYFPNKPPTLPTLSAGTKRTSFVKGLLTLCRTKAFWIVGGSYGIMIGMFTGWSAYLLPNLEHFLPDNTAQDESGWLGFYSTLVGCFAAVSMAKVSDATGGRMKLLIMILSLGAAAATVWFALVCLDVIPNTRAMVYASGIIAGTLINATMPLFLEAAVETTYPIDEGTTTAVATTLMNTGCLIFLTLPSIPGLGNLWANWTLASGCVAAFLLMFFFKERYRRMQFDQSSTRGQETLIQ